MNVYNSGIFNQYWIEHCTRIERFISTNVYTKTLHSCCIKDKANLGFSTRNVPSIVFSHTLNLSINFDFPKGAGISECRFCCGFEAAFSHPLGFVRFDFLVGDEPFSVLFNLLFPFVYNTINNLKYIEIEFVYQFNNYLW